MKFDTQANPDGTFNLVIDQAVGPVQVITLPVYEAENLISSLRQGIARTAMAVGANKEHWAGGLQCACSIPTNQEGK